MEPNIEKIKYQISDDEISLTDIFKVLIKRKRTMLLVFLGILSLSIAASLIIKKKYEYTAVIEIGTIIKQTATGSEVVLIDPPETVAAKFEHSYVPYVLNQYYQNNPDDEKLYKLSVSVPKKSELVKVTAKGREDTADIYLALLEQVTEQLKNDHKRLFEISRSKMQEQVIISKLDLAGLKDPKRKTLIEKKYEQQIKAINIKLIALSDQIKLEKNKKERFLETKRLLEKQLKDLTENINISVTNRSKAKIKVESSSDAMTLLLIDNEIQQYRNQMIALENRVYVDIANKIEEAENNIQSHNRQAELLRKELVNKEIEKQEQLENYERSVLKKEAHVQQVEVTLDNSKQTNVLVNPMQSIEPVGMSKKLIVLLGVFLGLFVSLFAAFIHEFVSNLKRDLSNV